MQRTPHAVHRATFRWQAHPSSDRLAACGCPNTAAGVGPKSTTAGTPNAAAACCSAESTPTKAAAPRTTANDSRSGRPRSSTAPGTRSSPGAPSCTSGSGERRARRAQPSALHSFCGRLAAGWIAT